MNNGIMNFAMMMLQNNPNVANTPIAQEAIKAMQTGDNQKGEAIANNLLQTMGITKEQAIQRAKSQFGLH